MTSRLEDLERRLERTGAETREKVDLLNELSEQLFFGDLSSRLVQVSSRAYELASRLSYPEGRASSLMFLGGAHWLLSNFDLALGKLGETKALFEELDDKVGLAKVLTFLSGTQRGMGDHEQAVQNAFIPLNVFEESGDRYWQALCLHTLGSLHHVFGDYEGSLRYYQQCIEKVQGAEQKWLIGRALDGVGTAYQSLWEHEKGFSTMARVFAPLKRGGAGWARPGP